MEYEVELKALCPDVGEMLSALSSAGAVPAGSEKQADFYFNHPSRDFMVTDEALRIRVVNGRTVLTYKGPRLRASAKTRAELEVPAGDFDTMKKILEHLGFILTMEIRKVRELYRYSGITVCIDRVEGLDTYIELEIKTADRAQAEHDLTEFASRMGLHDFEKRSYLEMLLDKKGVL